MIELKLDRYKTFFDHAWACDRSERAPVQLKDAANNSCLSLKEAANTQPPSVAADPQDGGVGFRRWSEPDMAVLIGQFRDWLFRDGRELKRVEKNAINGVINKIDQQLLACLRLSPAHRELAQKAGNAYAPGKDGFPTSARQPPRE
jgi:hypothetical protein